MKILVRLPNWLGDLVMSHAFIEQLQKVYPGAKISVIIKKGLEPILNYFPQVENQFLFSKEEFKGLKGAWKFGKQIKQSAEFDTFFSLPDSFSSALMGYTTGAKKRVGYKKELRSFLFTNAYAKNKGHHRVEQYLDLLRLFSGKRIETPGILLRTATVKKNNIIINMNSEASSRRLPREKAISIIDNVRKKTDNDIVLIGSGGEKEFVDEVFNSLVSKKNIINIAGTTSLIDLSEILISSKVILTTDSGPAHLANALGVKTVVLFGAGNENVTAPFNSQNRTIIRLGQLSCEPCQDNVCKRYGIPKCITLLEEELITSEVLKYLQ